MAYGINALEIQCTRAQWSCGDRAVRKAVKQHGEHEGEDEGGHESKKALGDAWRGACAGDGNPGPREEVGGRLRSGEEGPRVQRPRSQRDGLCEK